MAAEQIRKYSMVPERKTYQEPQRQVKQQPKKKAWFTKGEKVLYTTGLVLIAVAMILSVQYSSSVDSLNRDVQQINEEISKQETINTTLTAEVKEMSKPSRILSIAEEHGLNIKHAQVRQASENN
ncbi:cell division protein FtsL [Aquisalibacillus elongatus]|uniref:Cell division protein FtsL n=1 Tax=Aquisalibacillus elongatus TaxID=485577 RepID=A0A3N5BEF0_9BACI|nr:cell division protein FtsL [Aquisalibacillus elongatus]RPF56086.1 cell division protein FtsL [Aquisalibacillus elongatus]